MSKLLDVLSEYLARRRGLLPLIGLALIVMNLMIQFALPGSVVAVTNCLLHLGLIVAIFGLMLARAL
jgi:hypothetical protein